MGSHKLLSFIIVFFLISNSTLLCGMDNEQYDWIPTVKDIQLQIIDHLKFQPSSLIAVSQLNKATQKEIVAEYRAVIKNYLQTLFLNVDKRLAAAFSNRSYLEDKTSIRSLYCYFNKLLKSPIASLARSWKVSHPLEGLLKLQDLWQSVIKHNRELFEDQFALVIALAQATITDILLCTKQFEHYRNIHEAKHMKGTDIAFMHYNPSNRHIVACYYPVILSALFNKDSRFVDYLLPSYKAQADLHKPLFGAKVITESLGTALLYACKKIIDAEDMKDLEKIEYIKELLEIFALKNIQFFQRVIENVEPSFEKIGLSDLLAKLSKSEQGSKPVQKKAIPKITHGISF